MIFMTSDCEERIGYSFKDKSLLRKCFTHPSYAHERGGEHNERLEFFGDSILGFVVTEWLYSKYPDLGEGELTSYKQQIVSKKPLAAAIAKLKLDDYILFGEGERKNSDEKHEAARENLYEALLAGIYVDGGLSVAADFIKRTLLSNFRPKDVDGNVVEDKRTDGNFKGKLQEHVQKNKLGDIVYEEKSKSGPPHNPIFEMEVSVGGKALGKGKAGKKSEAERLAAKAAFEKLTRKNGSDGDKRKPPRAKTDKNFDSERKRGSENRKKGNIARGERLERRGEKEKD